MLHGLCTHSFSFDPSPSTRIQICITCYIIHTSAYAVQMYIRTLPYINGSIFRCSIYDKFLLKESPLSPTSPSPVFSPESTPDHMPPPPPPRMSHSREPSLSKPSDGRYIDTPVRQLTPGLTENPLKPPMVSPRHRESSPLPPIPLPSKPPLPLPPTPDTPQTVEERMPTNIPPKPKPRRMVSDLFLKKCVIAQYVLVLLSPSHCPVCTNGILCCCLHPIVQKRQAKHRSN